MITFLQGGAAKIKSKQFSEFGSRTTWVITVVYFDFQWEKPDAVWRSCGWESIVLINGNQVILAWTLKGVQGDIRCKVLAALSTVK